MAVVIGLAAAQYRQVYNSAEAGAQIRSFASDISPDGSYRYSFDTTNGIAAQEQGVGGHQAQGSYSYVSPEGIPIQVSYTADEYGFHPSGTNIRH